MTNVLTLPSKTPDKASRAKRKTVDVSGKLLNRDALLLSPTESKKRKGRMLVNVLMNNRMLVVEAFSLLLSKTDNDQNLYDC